MKAVIDLLLVEDDRVFAGMVRLWLDDDDLYSYRISHVDRADLAKTMLKEHEFGAILLDLILPNGQGMELIRSIRSLAKSTALVICTQLDDVDVAVSAIRECAPEFIPKSELKCPKTLQRILRTAMARHDGASLCQRAKDSVEDLRKTLDDSKREMAKEQTEYFGS